MTRERDAIMTTTPSLYGFDSSGRPSPCHARNPKTCRYHGDHRMMTKDEYETTMESWAQAHDTGDDNGLTESTDDNARVDTLLTSTLPLAYDRKGRIPDLDADDTPVDAVRKLARYINANYDGDASTDSIKAVRELWDDDDIRMMREDEYNPNVSALIRGMLAHGGISDVMVMTDGKSEYVVSTGKPVSKYMRSDARFRDTGRNVHVMDMSTLMSTRAIMGSMDMTGMERNDFAYGIIRDGLLDRNAKSYILNQDVRLDGLTYHDIKADRYLDELGLERIDGEPPSSKFARLRNAARSEHEKRLFTVWERDSHVMELGIRKRVLDSAATVLNDERNGELNKSYAKRNGTGHSATIWEDKKNQDDDHVRAAMSSSFARTFRHIEVDDSVDLDRFDRIQREWTTMESQLPKMPAPANFRFRKTGRHNAYGVYSPYYHSITVDQRHPSSMVHEWMHH